jgi:hypothetical protein
LSQEWTKDLTGEAHRVRPRSLSAMLCGASGPALCFVQNRTHVTSASVMPKDYDRNKLSGLY